MVDLGEFLRELLGIALGEAARDDEPLALSLLFILRHLEDRIDRLFFGGPDEAAGVDDDDLGLLGRGDEAIALIIAHTKHHLGVDAILRAAERDEVDGLRIVFLLIRRKAQNCLYGRGLV